MITLFILIAIYLACKDWEDSENAKERRHRERMQMEKRKLQRKKHSVRRTRTVAKDREGNVLAQEVVFDGNL